MSAGSIDSDVCKLNRQRNKCKFGASFLVENSNCIPRPRALICILAAIFLHWYGLGIPHSRDIIVQDAVLPRWSRSALPLAAEFVSRRLGTRTLSPAHLTQQPLLSSRCLLVPALGFQIAAQPRMWTALVYRTCNSSQIFFTGKRLMKRKVLIKRRCSYLAVTRAIKKKTGQENARLKVYPMAPSFLPRCSLDEIP